MTEDYKELYFRERKAREEADEHATDLRNEIIRLDAALAAPPSPLLPGLERAAEIVLSFPNMPNGRENSLLNMIVTEIRAEISRLKGEGSDENAG